MKRKFLFTPYIIFAAAWWMNGAAWDYLKMKKIRKTTFKAGIFFFGSLDQDFYPN